MERYTTGRPADHNGAVTSLDAARIAQSVVNIIELSPNQRIAADVTGDGSVSSLDAGRVAQFATELFEHFPVAVTEVSDWAHLYCGTYTDANNHDCGPPQSSHVMDGQFETADFYAIIYGDVSGNWEPAGSRAVATEEAAIAAEDRRRAEEMRAAGVSLDIGRKPRRDSPAILVVSGLEAPLAAGEQRQVVLALENAAGIEALDLALAFDSRAIAIRDVRAIGLGESMTLVSRTDTDRLLVAMYGLLPLAGSGSLLSVTVEALDDFPRRLPITISGEADEGGVRLRIPRNVRAIRVRHPAAPRVRGISTRQASDIGSRSR
jgi:hypothetical protein